MHIFQCKNKLGLSANEIDKFRNDFRDIFVTNKTSKTNLDDLKPKIDEYHQISEEGIIIETKQYFIFSGQKTINSTQAMLIFIRLTINLMKIL